MDGAIERVGVGEGLVGEMMGFEIVPDNLNVIELGGMRGRPAPRLLSCAARAAGRRGRRRRRPAGPSRCVAAGASGTFFTQQFG